MNNMPDKGVEQINKALEMAPNHVPSLVTLTIHFTIKGEFNTAKGYGVRAVTADPRNFAAHLVMARAHLGAHESADAVRELELARKLAPDSADVRFSLAAAYAQAGRKAEAAKERLEFQRLQKLLDSAGGNK
jgi:tetratricopeptide (TPR) repeat protein